MLPCIVSKLISSLCEFTYAISHWFSQILLFLIEMRRKYRNFWTDYMDIIACCLFVIIVQLCLGDLKQFLIFTLPSVEVQFSTCMIRSAVKWLTLHGRDTALAWLFMLAEFAHKEQHACCVLLCLLLLLHMQLMSQLKQTGKENTSITSLFHSRWTVCRALCVS